jgi:hypothetical protein
VPQDAQLLSGMLQKFVLSGHSDNSYIDGVTKKLMQDDLQSLKTLLNENGFYDDTGHKTVKVGPGFHMQ